jgi:hypothetical protein
MSLDDPYHARKEQGERKVRWRELSTADPSHRGFKYYPLLTTYTPFEWNKKSTHRFVAHVQSQHTDFQHCHDLDRVRSNKYRVDQVYWGDCSSHRSSYRQGMAHRRIRKRYSHRLMRRYTREWSADSTATVYDTRRRRIHRPRPSNSADRMTMAARVARYQQLIAEVAKEKRGS